MIYLFHGSAVEKVRAKAFEWVAKARAKEPNLVYMRLSREELTSAALEDAALSGGLFVRRLLVLIDDPFQKTETAEESENVLEENLDILTASDNAILILAPRLSATKAKKLEAKAKIAYRYDETEKEERGFNTNLVNALAVRNREKLWLEIVRALSLGDAPEMLHGLLHWKARDLMEKGLPAGRQGGRAWTPQEARRLSLSLISLLQDSRRRGLDLSRSLERFAFSLN